MAACRHRLERGRDLKEDNEQGARGGLVDGQLGLAYASSSSSWLSQAVSTMMKLT